MGYTLNMENWDPRLVHDLAQHYRVVMFDNAGVGHTQALPAPLTIDAMADQTSALINTLGLGRTDVMGWSMGGAIAQALAVLHPAQVRRLVLCATFPGTGTGQQPSEAALRAVQLFPANQVKADDAWKTAISEYPAAPEPSGATIANQSDALSEWWIGNDTAGPEIDRISAPTLIADGTEDTLVPLVDDHILAASIPGPG
jgi:pimeloyl-ACP methyl ester carboxylesterase